MLFEKISNAGSAATVLAIASVPITQRRVQGASGPGVKAAPPDAASLAATSAAARARHRASQNGATTTSSQRNGTTTNTPTAGSMRMSAGQGTHSGTPARG